MKRSPSGSVSRARWAAIGAAVAVSLGVGGVAVTNAIVSTGEKSVFIPITPCRLFDLRPAPDQVGSRGDPLGPGETYTEKVSGANGNCNIPADATAVAMNVTALGGTADSFLTIWPSGVTPRPVASNLNWVPGAPPTPNKVDVKLSPDGWIDLFNLAGHVSVLADVVGYYADHNHDDRYYTKAEIDAKLSSDIIMTHGLLFFPNAGTGAGTVTISNAINKSELAVTPGGSASLQLVGPKSQSGVAFGLKSVTYCMEAASGAVVNVAKVVGSAPALVQKFDSTPRTAAGCYTIAVNDPVSTSFTLTLELTAAVTGSIFVTGVTSTWGPAA
jgi:hypothetical protein